MSACPTCGRPRLSEDDVMLVERVKMQIEEDQRAIQTNSEWLAETDRQVAEARRDRRDRS